MITRLGRILRCANQSNRRRVERSADFIHCPGGHARLGMEFKEIYDAMMSFSMNRVGKAGSAGMNRLGATVCTPNVTVQSEELRGFAGQLGRLTWRSKSAVNRALVVYREPVLETQHRGPQGLTTEMDSAVGMTIGLSATGAVPRARFSRLKRLYLRMT
jgi:hypothetical protein